MGKQLILPSESIRETKVHPVVVFQILDRFLRKSEGQDRVIGTLLGTVENGVAEITNSFPVPHLEKGEEVAVGKDFHKQMYALHQSVSTKETIIGWYATSSDGSIINEQSCLIHDFYGSECNNPVHLVLDTSLREQEIGMSAFISTALSLVNCELVNQFKQIEVSTIAEGAEKIALDVMIQNRAENWGEGTSGLSSLPSDLNAVETSLTRLYEMIDAASTYVNSVVNGETNADTEIGLNISHAVASVPFVDPATFDRIFNTSLQDLLMVTYLSSLTKAQLTIGEKLLNGR